jgi:hypothetical protein
MGATEPHHPLQVHLSQGRAAAVVLGGQLRIQQGMAVPAVLVLSSLDIVAHKEAQAVHTLLWAETAYIHSHQAVLIQHKGKTRWVILQK